MSGFVDVPLFGEPAPVAGPVQWTLSKRDEEEALKPRWLRYRGPMVRCAEEALPKRCNPATWLRITGAQETVLCAQHKQQFLDDEFLRTPRGSQ